MLKDKLNQLKKIGITIRNLSLSLCSKMALTLLSRPHLLWGTGMATVQATIISSEKCQGSSNMGNGIGNAYKHALWSALIAQKTKWAFRDYKDAIVWAKKITDLHEICFPNVPEENKMDLGNNTKGLELYKELYLLHKSNPTQKQIAEELYKRKETLIVLE